MLTKTIRVFGAAAIMAALLLSSPLGTFAHTIPSDVTLQAFVKPSGAHLYLLVRVPLKAMSDMEFPEREPGSLDLARVEPTLREGATRYVSDAIELYENDTAS